MSKKVYKKVTAQSAAPARIQLSADCNWFTSVVLKL